MVEINRRSLNSVAKRLLTFKKSDDVLIVLNGPSSLSLVDSNALSRYDVICMSSGIHIPSVAPNLYFHEPFETLCSDSVLPIDVLWRCIEGLNVARANVLIASGRCGCIVSPQPFKDYSVLPIQTLTSQSDWFFVDESSLISGVRGLRHYLRLSRAYCYKLLNYRCTLFRAISVAMCMNYKSLSVIGLDPSTSRYWFMHPSLSEDSRRSSSPMLPVLYSYGRNLKRLADEQGIRNHQDYGGVHDGHHLDHDAKSIPGLLFLLLSELALVDPVGTSFLRDPLRSVRVFSDDLLVVNLGKRYGLGNLVHSVKTFENF